MSTNPFDIRTVVLARHAQHVVLIHFPIALFTAAVGFDYLAQWTKNRGLTAAAYFNLVAAAVSTVPVVATGLIAWRWALEGQKLKGILLLHLVLGSISTLLVWLVLWLRHKGRRQSDPLPSSFVLCVELVGLLAITITGHLGGFLSGVNSPM